MAFPSPEHSHRSSFFWDSKLPDERKDRILAWLKTLTNNEVQHLNDLLADVREDERYNCEAEGCPNCDA